MTRAQTPLPRPRPRRFRAAFVALSALSCCWAASASAGVSVVQTNAVAAFAQPVNGRTPARVFFTDLGVYELDTAAKAVRIWQRSDEGLEMLLPAGGAAMESFTEVQYQFSSPRPQRFTGVDAAGNGTVFNHPAGLALHPAANKFAVVSGGDYQETKLVENVPSVQVYSFDETAGADGALESVSLSLEAAFREAFFTTTNGMEQVLAGYTNIVTVTGTNEVIGVSSNWIYVVSVDPLVTETNGWETARVNRPPPDDVLFPDERFLVLSEGLEYPVVIKRTRFVGTTNVETIALYDYVYDVTTNASYLSTATDVAFLGDAGFVVPISDCGYSEAYNDKQWDLDHWVTNYHEVSGLVVFDAADPGRAGLVFPCATNLPGKIAGIDVDPDTGDIYVAVPSASAVYRYKAPAPGDVSSWLTLPDRTVIVRDPDFLAGGPSMSGAGFGQLSDPADVAVWSPDAGAPILLVADRANDRAMAFDSVNTTWSATNWLGTSYRPASTNVVVAPDPALGFVVSTNTVSVQKPSLSGLSWTTVLETRVSTNWFRVENTAFPLFEVADAGHPLNKPKGVFGRKGANVLAVADASGQDVRLYRVDVEALSDLYSDEVRPVGVFWPGVEEGFPDVSTRDFAVGTNDATGVVVARWDAPHENPSAAPYFTAVESDDGVNVLTFSVDPARTDRTYNLSISPADGVVSVLSGTATVPAGGTTGTFSFLARDGVESVETNVVLWATNAAPDGVVVRFATNEWCDAVAFAETNVFRSTPLYRAEIVSEDGACSTNVAIVVANAAPLFTNAYFRGYVIPGDPVWNIPPEIYLYGLGVAATDVAADSNLRFLWWTTTDLTWAAENIRWAVTNNDWAASATAEWKYLNEDDPAVLVTTNWVDYQTAWPPSDYDGELHYYTVETNYASFFAPHRETATDAAVVRGVDLYVARGLSMPLPFDYNVPNGPYLGYRGLSPGASWGTTPFIVVCTVLDKDGGASVVTFPQKKGSADYDADWQWDGVDIGSFPYQGVPEQPVAGARYAARFVGVSATNVAFEIWIVSDTQAASDRLQLESATTLSGPWTVLRDNIPVGLMDFSAGTVTNNVTPAGTGTVLFYRVVQP